MPIVVNIDNMVLQYQAKHNRRLTLQELADLTGIPLPTLNRIKGNYIKKADLSKINKLCKVLECEPGDLIKRVKTNLFVGGTEAEEYQQMLDGIAAAEDED